MIFSVGNHVQLIQKGQKTQTRRDSDRYEVGKTYAIQPCRTCKAIKEGRIMIIDKKWEMGFVHPVDAKAEGGYRVDEFEELYEKLHPFWYKRWAYTFRFIPNLKLAVEGDKTKENTRK